MPLACGHKQQSDNNAGNRKPKKHNHCSFLAHNPSRHESMAGYASNQPMGSLPSLVQDIQSARAALL
jgi:hypothetical protein